MNKSFLEQKYYSWLLGLDMSMTGILRYWRLQILLSRAVRGVALRTGWHIEKYYRPWTTGGWGYNSSSEILVPIGMETDWVVHCGVSLIYWQRNKYHCHYIRLSGMVLSLLMRMDRWTIDNDWLFMPTNNTLTAALKFAESNGKYFRMAVAVHGIQINICMEHFVAIPILHSIAAHACACGAVHSAQRIAYGRNEMSFHITHSYEYVGFERWDHLHYFLIILMIRICFRKKWKCGKKS